VLRTYSSMGNLLQGNKKRPGKKSGPSVLRVKSGFAYGSFRMVIPQEPKRLLGNGVELQANSLHSISVESCEFV